MGIHLSMLIPSFFFSIYDQVQYRKKGIFFFFKRKICLHIQKSKDVGFWSFIALVVCVCLYNAAIELPCCFFGWFVLDKFESRKMTSANRLGDSISYTTSCWLSLISFSCLCFPSFPVLLLLLLRWMPLHSTMSLIQRSYRRKSHQHQTLAHIHNSV